jgi:hypothetical protein
VEDDGNSLVGLQAPKAAVELIVVLDRAGEVAGRPLDPDHPDLGRSSLPPSALIGAGIDDQTMQPRVPSVRVAQGREVSPGMDECFLDGVLGEVRVPQGQASDSEEAVASGRRENLEGLVIALACRLDDIALHGPLRRFRVTVARSTLHDGT